MNVRALRKRSYRKTGGPLGLGKRCKDYAAGCIVCESYRFFDETGRFSSFDEAHARAKEAMRLEDRAPASSSYTGSEAVVAITELEAK